MNFKSIGKILGWLLLVEALLLIIPALISIVGGESATPGFLVAAALAACLGAALYLPLRKGNIRLRRREGFFLTSVVWIIFSFIGMIPFLACGAIDSPASAFFETMSGFTTTGASVFSNVESLPKSILFWRALMQWVGGLGIVLFLLAMLPQLNQSGGITVYNAETTGITHDKLHPRIRQTVLSLWKIYAVITILLILLLWAGPMDLFDSICQAFATVSTGGFSTRNSGIAYWQSDYVLIVLTLFMTAAGVNFFVIYDTLRGGWRSLRSNDVFIAYIAIILAASAAVALSLALSPGSDSFSSVVIEPLFQISSAITSTGFSASGYPSWSAVAMGIVILMMIVGACAGSTAGGLKIDRVVVLYKNMKRTLQRTLYPTHVIDIESGGRLIDSERMNAVGAFLALYLVVLILGTLLMCAFGYSLQDSFFATVSCVGDNGLGYGATASGYGSLPAVLKWVMSAEMLLGRLEFFTVICVFIPAFWRR